MNKRTPWNYLVILFLISFLVTGAFFLPGKINDPSPTSSDTGAEIEGQPISPTLLGKVGSVHREILNNGSSAFGPNCLKRFPRAFKRGEELTEVPTALLAGIAGYESAGCSKPKDGAGNVMHVTLADDEHIAEAAHLLGIPKAALNWKRHSEHSVVLGAVMLQDYYERTESVEAALAAYRHGPSSKRDGERYAHLVLAHGVSAIRHQWNWVTEIQVDQTDGVDEVDIKGLVRKMRLSPHPVEAPPSLLAMQE